MDEWTGMRMVHIGGGRERGREIEVGGWQEEAAVFRAKGPGMWGASIFGLTDVYTVKDRYRHASTYGGMLVEHEADLPCPHVSSLKYCRRNEDAEEQREDTSPLDRNPSVYLFCPAHAD